MIDPALIAICKKAVAAKPRKHVTTSDVVAVAMQESHGVPTFTPWDVQFKLNLRTAVRVTGMSEADIRKLIIIPADVNGWKTPAIMVDKFAKFRLEPSYWGVNRELENADRFYKSCSWGLGQLMGVHLSDTAHIRRFMADVSDQALWIAGMIDSLMTASDGSLFRAYKGYNSGNTESQNKDVIARANSVCIFKNQVEAQIKEQRQ